MDSKSNKEFNQAKSPFFRGISPERPTTHLEFTISDAEFALFRELIYDLIGIQLNENKKMLVISRLSRRLRSLQLSSFSQYYEFITQSATGTDELVNLINQITTNKTDFFREAHHFDFLQQDFLPKFLEKRQNNLRIWSAGCSSGEEPYTIAMSLLNFFISKNIRPESLDIKILATDIDTNVLEKASEGIYKNSIFSDIPSSYQQRFFEYHGPNQVRVKPMLQSLISFRRFNLIHPFPFKFGFDLIFCRNVLIYFKQSDRLQIVRKFNSVLRQNGYLILGHSESLLVDNCGFRSLGNTVYRKE